MTKRMRHPSHYLAGLGDGDVKAHMEHGSHRRDQRKATKLRSTHKDSETWDVYLQDQAGRMDPSTTTDPWQFSALALLASVVLMSAIFLHLVSDTSTKKGIHGFRRSRRRPSSVNKKTDKWTEDEEDEAYQPTHQVASSDAGMDFFKPYAAHLQQRIPPREAVDVGGNFYGTKAVPPGYRSPVSKGNMKLVSSNFVAGSPSAPPKHKVFDLSSTSSPRTSIDGAYPSMMKKPGFASQVEPLPSRCSSFGSLVAVNTAATSDEEMGTPQQSPVPSHGRTGSDIEVEIGNADFDMSEMRRTNDDTEDTPRVTNKRILETAQHSAQYDHWLNQGLQPLSNLSMGFASPPKGKVLCNSVAVPYVPSLSSTRNEEQPPLPVNVDELQLNSGESGNLRWINIPHGQSVAQQILQDASCHPENIEHKPIDKQRPQMEHIRPDLTIGTNAAQALQGAIDFSQLDLIEIIGGGGFGQVWRAKWRGTPVAVKVLNGSAQSKNVPKPILEEFAAEINLLGGMSHPNICLYMGACIHPPHRAIVTELAANGSLWDALRLPLREPFLACDGATTEGWPEWLYESSRLHGSSLSATQQPQRVPPRFTWPFLLVKKVALGVCRGMAYLHGGLPSVLHRDLKSANILLDESYNPKVCDFGLSRLKAKEQSMTGNCGTVQWMAPEVLASQRYDEKADIFSFSIICWELLTRQCPYDGMTAIQCALSVLNRNSRPDIPLWCPQQLHDIIRSCWKKEAADRPTFEELIDVFDNLTLQGVSKNPH